MVDDAVELPDGRRLAYCVLGDPGGAPVVYHHGTPGSRLGVLPATAGGAAHQGIRLITFDRPGYGRSDERAGFRHSDVAADVAALCDRLDVPRFGVCGMSGGGPGALACVALLPHRVARVAILASPAPFDADAAVDADSPNAAGRRAALQGRTAVEDYLSWYANAIRGDPCVLTEELIPRLPPPDRDIVRRDDVRRMLAVSDGEAVRGGVAGWVEDTLAMHEPWGFEPGDIAAPVRIWHGALDTLVPAADAERLAGSIPGAELTLIPSEGHMLYDRLPGALAWAAGA